MASEKIRYFVWRDGRPRWVPGPKARDLGFKGTDLKDASGAWLSRPKAREAAEKLNEALDAKVSGTPAPMIVSVSAYQRSLAHLVDQFLARPKISLDETIAASTTRPGKKPLSRSSRLAYHNHGALLKTWMGDAPAAAITPAMFEQFYDDRIADSSVRTANAIMASAKAFYYFGEDKLRWDDLRNPVTSLELDDAGGRCVVWPKPEIDCYVAIADYLGWPSLGDALIHALLTTQRRNDLLPLKGAAIDAGDIYRFVQSKTGQEAAVKAVPTLLNRVRAMRQRKFDRWGARALQHEIICEATGEPYPVDGNYFGRRFAAMRLIAAGGNGRNSDMDEAMQLLGLTDGQLAAMPIARMPSLNNLWFRDLRDTAITWLAKAECSRYEISKVSGLSLQSVDTILKKHYLVLDDSFAISAGDKLAAHMERSA